MVCEECLLIRSQRSSHSIWHLILVVLGFVAYHVEESQLVHPRASRHHAQPVAKLLLLEEFLRPVVRQVSVLLGFLRRPRF